MPPVRIPGQLFDARPGYPDGRRRLARFALRVSGPWLLLTLAVAGLPALASEVKQAGTVHRIGMLYAAAPRGSAVDEAFRQGLRELGWREGENIVIDFRSAGGQYDRLPDLAGELVQLKPDVIFVPAELAIRAVRKATATIPIVMAAVTYDPIDRGLIASIAKPGGNITGLFLRQIEMSGKRLQLVREVVPGAFRMAVLFDPAEGGAQLKETEAVARSSGVQFQLLEVRAPSDIDKAVSAAARGRVGALIVLASPLTYVERTRIATEAVKHRLPTMSPFSELTEAGGLLSYGASFAEMFRQAARHVDKILRGARAAELPVEQPTRFELAVNLKTARALGLTLPQSVLVLADKVIQ
jgi:putative ABC transport system substrate-binding protein